MRERNKEIHRRQRRRAKLKKLKALLVETKEIKKREEIIAKIRKYQYRFSPD